MESKLKVLKVVDLRDILAKASVSAPAKANKQDLIARIIASPAALSVYNKQNTAVSTPAPSSTTAKTSPTQTDDLLAPPEDVDWNEDEASASEPPPEPVVSPAKPPTAKPVSSTKSKATVTSATAITSPTVKPAAPTSPVQDAEFEQRKKRAARFGVPLVEPPKPRPAPSKRGSNRDTNPSASSKPTPTASQPVASSIDDPEKLKARAARFGTGAASTAVTGQKRSAPAEIVDPEELERRRKRAERFGTAPVGTKA